MIKRSSLPLTGEILGRLHQQRGGLVSRCLSCGARKTRQMHFNGLLFIIYSLIQRGIDVD